MKPTVVFALLSTAILGLSGCAPEVEVPADAFARFGDEFVTTADLDRAFGAMSANERREANEDPQASRERTARDIAYRHLLLARAAGQGTAEDSMFQRQMRQLERETVARAYLGEAIEMPQVTEEEIAEYYRSNVALFQRPARREVYQVFLRRLAGESDAELGSRLDVVRSQATDLGSMMDVAHRVSDSETRHQRGRIGWMIEGQLAPELSAIIFALEPQVPSRPFLTGEGGHIFFVSQIAEAVSMDLEEARSQIGRTLVGRRRGEAVDRLLDDVESPAGSYVPTPEDLRTILASSDPSVLVLRIGDYELKAGELRRLLANQGGNGNPLAVAQAIERRELCYQLASAEGFRLPAAAEEALHRREESALVELQRRKELLEMAAADEARLLDFYLNNKARFTTPLELDLQVLAIPDAHSSDRVMRGLEASRDAIATGEVGLGELAQRLRGRVTEHSGVTVPRLSGLSPKAPPLVLTLGEGEVSYPFRAERGILMVSVTGRREPTQRSFEEARLQVRESYVVSHGADLDADLLSRLLAEIGFELIAPDQGPAE